MIQVASPGLGPDRSPIGAVHHKILPVDLLAEHATLFTSKLISSQPVRRHSHARSSQDRARSSQDCARSSQDRARSSQDRARSPQDRARSYRSCPFITRSCPFITRLCPFIARSCPSIWSQSVRRHSRAHRFGRGAVRDVIHMPVRYEIGPVHHKIVPAHQRTRPSAGRQRDDTFHLDQGSAATSPSQTGFPAGAAGAPFPAALATGNPLLIQPVIPSVITLTSVKPSSTARPAAA